MTDDQLRMLVLKAWEFYYANLWRTIRKVLFTGEWGRNFFMFMARTRKSWGYQCEHIRWPNEGWQGYQENREHLEKWALELLKSTHKKFKQKGYFAEWLQRVRSK